MKNYRILTCLLTLLLVGMIGISACAETDLSALEAAVDAAKTGLAMAQAAVDNLGSVENDTAVKAATAALNSKLAEQTANNKLIAINNSETTDVKADLADVEATIKEDLAALEEEKAVKEAGATSAADALKSIEAALTAAQDAEKDATDALEAIEEKQGLLDAAETAQLKTAEALAQQLIVLNEAKKETEEKKAAVTAAKNVLTAAEQAIENEEAIVQELRDKVTEAETYLNSLPSFLQGAEKEALKIAQQALDAGEAAFDAKLPELQKAVTDAKEEVAEAEAEVEKAEAAQATAQTEYDNAEKANKQALADIDTAQKALDDQKTAYETAQKQAQDLQDKYEALLEASDEELLKAAVSLYNTFMENYEARKATINGTDDTLSAQLAQLEGEAAILAANAAKIASEIEKLEANLEAAEKAFADKKAELEAALDKAQAALVAAEKALEDAENAIQDAIDNGKCEHNSLKISAFGSSFCPLKAAGSCTHGDKCCPNVSTGTISSTIKGYIQSGDYQGLKSEAQGLYNQVSALQGTPVESLVRGLIESAVNAKANEYLGAENWSALKNLANQMMSAGELNSMIDQVVNQLRGQIDSAINSALNGNPAALNALLAKIDELKANFGGIDLDKAEIEAKLIQAAKNALNSAKAEIKAMIDAASDEADRAKIEAAINNAVAALRNLNKAEINAAIEQFISELKGKLEDKLGDIGSQGKAEIEAMIQSALNSDCAKYIADKAAALKAKIEAKLAEIHVCEESAEVVAQEMKALIAAYEDEILAYLQQKADALCVKLAGLVNADLSEAEIKALVSKALSMLKELAKSKLNSLQAIINEILSHTRVVIPAVEPTCGTIGWTEGLKCVCGYVLVAPQMIPATGEHIYVNGVCSCGAKDPNYVAPSNPTNPGETTKPVVTPRPPVVTPEPPVVTPEPPVVTPEPPVVTPEPPVVTPEPPVVTPEVTVVPALKLDYYYNNTMSSYGPTTRELVGGNDWYRVTPVDLSVDGVYTYDLIASNRYVVGTVTIKVEAGELTVSYEVNARPCTVKDEVLKIYASKADLAAGNAIEAKFGEGITFGTDTKVIVSLILTGDYAINGYKVTNMIINDAEIAAMIANMD